jgi:hypothetical protein
MSLNEATAAAAVAATTKAAANVAADAEKAKALVAVAASAHKNKHLKAQALVAVAASADKRAKKADESDEDGVVESLLQPLPEGMELAVCDRCGCPDGLPPGARICLNCVDEVLAREQKPP